MTVFLTQTSDSLHDIICPHCSAKLEIEDLFYFDSHWLEKGHCEKCGELIIVEKVTEVKFNVQKDESLPSDNS